MSEAPQEDEESAMEKQFTKEIGERESRKMRARREASESIWLGLGVIGTVGWAVAVPMLIGLAVGIWLDSIFPGLVSWTLTLLILGLALGCFNAWFWISREQKMIERRKEERKRE